MSCQNCICNQHQSPDGEFGDYNSLEQEVQTDGQVEVQVDLDQDLFNEIALEAHKQNITVNQLVNDILREYIDRQIEIQETKETEDALVDAVMNILNVGITTESLKEYGYAFDKWNNTAVSGTTIDELHAEAFDAFEHSGKI